MHVEFCTTGPTEVARSRHYDAIAIAPDFENMGLIIEGLDRQSESWEGIANAYQYDGRIVVDLANGRGLDGVAHIFVDTL